MLLNISMELPNEHLKLYMYKSKLFISYFIPALIKLVPPPVLLTSVTGTTQLFRLKPRNFLFFAYSLHTITLPNSH